MAEREGFGHLTPLWNVQLADSPLPSLPFLPWVPLRLARYCTPPKFGSWGQDGGGRIRLLAIWYPYSADYFSLRASRVAVAYRASVFAVTTRGVDRGLIRLDR